MTREELRQHLWPSDTFVDFDHALNTAVMKLRDALGDSTEKPLYIQTIPRRGYRFVAPVLGGAATAELKTDELQNGKTGSIERPSPSEEIRPHGTEVSAAEDARQHTVRTRLRPRLIALSVISALLLLVVTAWLVWRPKQNPHSDAQEAVSPNMRIRPITNVRGYVDSPSFSPDGREIAFTWQPADQARNDVYRQIVGGDVPLRLTHIASGFVDFPEWSPDGREIAFTWCNGKEEGIYLVPALGGEERKLTSIECRYWGWRRWGGGRPTWTPDGKGILFVDRCRPAGPHGVVLFSLATAERTCITAPDSPNDFDFLEALSPDGKTVALLRGTSAVVSDIYTVPLSGGTARRLTFENRAIWTLMWTPDGKFIVFESDRGVTPNTWKIAKPGGAITPERVYPRVGSLSNDGRFSFVQKLNMEHAIWRVRLSAPGGTVLDARKLTHSQHPEEQMQVSADGTRIVYQSERTGDGEIWVSSIEGDNARQLTSLGRGTGGPRWSPDGHWVTFDSRPAEYGQIYIADADGRNLRMITRGPYDSVEASWSPDAKWIYFCSMRAGTYQIWKHFLEDGSEVQLTQRGGSYPLESYDGRTLYYTRDDPGDREPGIWSMPVSGGREVLVIPGRPQAGYGGFWAVTDPGIYLLDADAQPRSTILFYSFATRKISPVLQLERAPCSSRPGLSASRDGRTVLVSECDYQSVVKIMENFR